MKRLIKFWGQYSDECKFSTCSTQYEVLPVLVSDSAGDRELRMHAKQLKIGIRRKAIKKADRLTHAVECVDKTKQDFKGEMVSRVTYLGFIKIEDTGTLKPVVSKKPKSVSKDQAMEIINSQEYGVYDTWNEYVIMDGWEYFHQIRLLGYSLESFERQAGITERTFHDEVESCSDCGERNWVTNNFRYVESEGMLGIECGCYETYCENNYKKNINNPKQSIELETAEKLASKKKIKFVERFIGGMTDGRGGSYGGEFVRENQPESVLKTLLTVYPKGKFIFTHDESGQFQTYFSVWKVSS